MGRKEERKNEDGAKDECEKKKGGKGWRGEEMGDGGEEKDGSRS